MSGAIGRHYNVPAMVVSCLKMMLSASTSKIKPDTLEVIVRCGFDSRLIH